MSAATPAASHSGLDEEIVRNGLLVAAEEAAITVVRAAHSQFIVEGADAGTAILTRTGELVAQAAATSMLHSGGMVDSLRAVLEDVDVDTMADGDAFVVNDPYRGGVHANDVMVCRPVVIGGRVELFAATLIHVLDLGGGAHGGINAQAVETYEEGLQIPPLHLERAGRRNRDLEALIKLNSRSPVETMGDIDALAAGALVCARRVRSLAEEHGLDRLHAAIDRYLAETEARTRSEIAGLRDGSYTGRAVIDDDGHGRGPHEIRVRVDVDGDRLRLDFTGTGPQVRAAINSSASQAFDAAVFAVRCFVDKTIPTNSGLFRPITAHFPRGSLLNPDPPHPCGGRMMATYAVVDAIVEALAGAVPERTMARSGILHGFALAGVGEAQYPYRTTPPPPQAASADEPPRRPYWLHNAFDFGGVGARIGHDGADATGFHFGVGRSQIPQVEPVEARCGLLVEAVELIPDSGGPGRWRGGLGVRTTFRLGTDAVVSVRTDGFASPPTGVRGGGTGRPGAFYALGVDGTRRDIPSKAANVPLRAGEAFVVETSGGGGVGPARERPVDEVMRDVRAGRVSRWAAAEHYGVVVAPDGRSGHRP